MGHKYKEVGGGAATGLSNDLIGFLGQGLNSGTFGAAGRPNAVENTMGIAGVLNNILSPGGGTVGKGISDQISQETDRQAQELRARFSSAGGASYGTPAAYAEAQVRAQAAPQAAVAVGQLQMNTLMPLLQIIAGISQKGITQREVVDQPNPWIEGITATAGLLKGVSGFFDPFGGGGGSTPASGVMSDSFSHENNA